MSGALHYVLIYIAIPIVATIAGGAVCVFYSPSRKVRSAFQHFAAGLVFAAVSTSLLPEMLRAHDLRAVIAGFTVGIGLMLVIKWLSQRGHAVPDSRQPRSLVLAAAVDYLVDGLLIGIGFAVGAKAGGLLTFALSIEGMFLAAAVISSMKSKGVTNARLLLTASLFGLLLAVGGIIGAGVIGGLSGSLHTAIVSFGSAALIYLVTEELLVEAHDRHVPENPLTAAIFFVGFLLLICIEMSY